MVLDESKYTLLSFCNWKKKYFNAWNKLQLDYPNDIICLYDYPNDTICLCDYPNDITVFAYLFFGHVQEVSEHGPFDGLQAGGCGQAAHVPVVVG